MKRLRSASGIAVTLGLGACGDPVLRLLRVVFVIRLVSPEDYGLAIVFGLSTTLVDLISNFGAEQLLIQSKRGNDDHFGRSIHSFVLIRGLLLGALLYVLAPFIAAWFRVEHATWALRLLALVPVMGGLANRDIWRIQRDLRYVPYTITVLGSGVIALACAAPIALWTRDYRVFLYTALIQSAARLVFSHLLAERRYRLDWKPKVFREVFDFGWPLILSGMAFFMVSNGDRMIIGRAYSPDTLAWYGAASSVAAVGGGIFVQIMMKLTLPSLSKVSDDPTQFQRRFEHLNALAALLCAVTAGAYFLMGPAVIVGLYGEAFASSAMLIQWMGVVQAATIMRSVSNQSMVAKGDTRSPSLTVGLRGLSLPLLIATSAWGLGVVWAVYSVLVGEFLATVVSFYFVTKRHGTPVNAYLRHFLLPGLVAAGAGCLLLTGWRPDSFVSSFGMALLMSIALTAIAAFMYRTELRDYLRDSAPPPQTPAKFEDSAVLQ